MPHTPEHQQGLGALKVRQDPYFRPRKDCNDQKTVNGSFHVFQRIELYCILLLYLLMNLGTTQDLKAILRLGLISYSIHLGVSFILQNFPNTVKILFSVNQFA